MDFTTSITDHQIAVLGGELRAPPPRIDRRQIPTTVGKESRPVESASSSNSLPMSILANWSKIARANMSVGMYADLVRIAGAQDGWRGSGSLSLRSESLNDFLEFWSTVRDDAVEPEVALAPDGSLHAEWFKSMRRRLDVRFAKQRAFFGLFTNDGILEGVDHLNAVAQILKSHHSKPLTWSAG